MRLSRCAPGDPGASAGGHPGRARSGRASSARLAPGTGVAGFPAALSQGFDPAGHRLTEKVGCQKLSGQKKIEVKY